MTGVRDERGFTLVELMVAALIGTIVILAAFSLVDVSVQSRAETENRVEAVQRGRMAMEQITRQLRSQVCPGQGQATVIDAENDRVTFYGLLASQAPGSGPLQVQKRQVAFVQPSGAPRGQIVERVWTKATPDPLVLTFNEPPRTRVITDNVTREGTTPVFRYAKYDPATSPDLIWLTPPVPADAKGLIVQVRTTFRAWPNGGRKATEASTLLDSKVFVRTADPTDPEHSPKCI